MIVDMKVQCLRSGKALGIGKYSLARAAIVLRWIDHSMDIILSYEAWRPTRLRSRSGNVQIIIPGTELAGTNNKT